MARRQPGNIYRDNMDILTLPRGPAIPLAVDAGKGPGALISRILRFVLTAPRAMGTIF